MTNEEIEEFKTLQAVALSTQHFLIEVLAVVREEGIISQEQIHRAVEQAKSKLCGKGALGIHASLFLEATKGEI